MVIRRYLRYPVVVQASVSVILSVICLAFCFNRISTLSLAILPCLAALAWGFWVELDAQAKQAIFKDMLTHIVVSLTIAAGVGLVSDFGLLLATIMVASVVITTACMMVGTAIRERKR